MLFKLIKLSTCLEMLSSVLPAACGPEHFFDSQTLLFLLRNTADKWSQLCSSHCNSHFCNNSGQILLSNQLLVVKTFPTYCKTDVFSVSWYQQSSLGYLIILVCFHVSWMCYFYTTHNTDRSAWFHYWIM